jgi:hypothetical protein
LLQKEQEQELQQQLLMKKNKTSKSSMESRLEAKQKKADMLKKSLQLQIAKGRGTRPWRARATACMRFEPLLPPSTVCHPHPRWYSACRRS